MERKTKILIGSAASIGLLAVGKIIQIRNCHKMLNRYNLDHNNSPLTLGKKRVRVKVGK